MDPVAAAQLIFPAVCTDAANLQSNCSAYVTEMLFYCNAFASLDQKSPAAYLGFSNYVDRVDSKNRNRQLMAFTLKIDKIID